MATDEFLLGKRDRISLVEETSFASGGSMANGEVIGINAEIDPDFNKNWQEVLSAGADSRAVESMQAGDEAWPFTLNFTPVNWRWLKYLMNVADAGSDPYTHTFSVANTLNTFKIEWARRHTTPHVLTGVGGFMKNATVSFNKPTGPGREGFIRVSAECNAKTFTQGSSVTSLSNLSKAGFQFRMAKLTLNSSEIVEVNNGEFTIDEEIDEQDSRYANATQDKDIAQPIAKTFRMTGRLNVTVKDKTFWDLWDAGTAVSGTNKLEFVRGANDDLDITFNELYISGPGEGATDLEGPVTLDINFEAAGEPTIVATDDISSY